MNNIEAIHDRGSGMSHWVVKGPAGSKVEFDARMTQNVPNEVVAWETTPDSMVQHRGQVRFKENRGDTQVNVNMAYSPPAGVAGHAVAKMFGKDPKSEMDADLARLKTLLEEGKTTAKNRKVTREEVVPVTGENRQSSQSRRQDEDEMTGMDDETAMYRAGEGRIEIDDEDEYRSMGGIGGGPLNTDDI